MTLALIAVIVFLIVWGCQVGDRKAKKKEYQDKTRTNLVLEKEIYSKVEEEISLRLNSEEIPVGEIYPRLLQLFDEYGVAYHVFNVSWGKHQSREDFIDALTEECRNEELLSQEKSQKLPCFSCTRSGGCNQCNEREKAARKRSTMDRIQCQHMRKYATKQYGKSFYTMTSRLEATYRGLLYGLTRKRMYELGYATTRDGLRESEWQEREKEQKEMEQLRAKYPYLFR